MRRFTLGFLLAFALIVPVALVAAPPKAVNVVNPMAADLDANGHAISNASTVTTANGAGALFNFLTAHSLNLSTGEDAYVDGPQLSVFAGSSVPTSGVFGNQPPGSLYLRQPDTTHGQLWFKAGPNLADWACVAGC